VPEKIEMDRKKVLANPWNRKRIRKTPHAGRGLETKWEIPIKFSFDSNLNHEF
jgi:hypothetical protein